MNAIVKLYSTKTGEIARFLNKFDKNTHSFEKEEDLIINLAYKYH